MGRPTRFPSNKGAAAGASGEYAPCRRSNLQVAPQFTEHGFEEETSGDDSIDNGPTGGLTWDGRVDRGRQQACIPLLSSHEMANHSEANVVAVALKASYSEDLKKLSASTETKRLFETILEALETWQENYKEFYPYNSKL